MQIPVKKIVIFIPAIENGGVERNAIWVANGLAERGLEVDMVYSRIEAGQAERVCGQVHMVKFDTKPIAHIHERLSDAITIRRAFGMYLSQQEAESTVVIAFQSASVAIPICKKHGIKVICRLSNHPSAVQYETSWVRKLAEWLKPRTYKKADAVIGNSVRLSEDFGKTIGKEVVTIYNPIDLARVEREKNEGTLEPMLMQDVEQYKGRVYVTVGRLAGQKDIATLLKGFAASRHVRESVLWIVGEGSKETELKQLAKDLGIDSQVRFVGFRRNVFPYLRYADLFVQTSLYEGCPNALIEAVAAGLPAIATDCLSGPSEVLVEGQGGDLIPIRDYESLGKRLDNYVEHPEELQDKAKIARECLDKFSSDNVMNQYMELLNRIAG